MNDVPLDDTPALPGRRRFIAFLMAMAALQANGTRPALGASPSRRAAESAAAAATLRPSITRAAIIHDALSLLAADADVTGAWQDVLLPLSSGKPFEFSYAYGVANIADDGQLLHDVVAEVRTGWADRQPAFMDIQRHKGGMMERRLAVALGWAANNAATPVLFAGATMESAELAIDGIFLRSLLRIETIGEPAARRAFRVLYERAMVAMHTVEPDLDGPGGLDITAMHEVGDPQQSHVNRYMDAYADWIENIDLQCTRLARAIAAAEPAGLPRGDEFYRSADPIVARAEGLRRGIGTAAGPGLRTAGRSRYAQALAAAYDSARLVLEAARGDRPAADLDSLIAP